MTTTLQNIPLTTIDGAPATLAQWAGQVLLVVNVASKCGLTPQYAGLQALRDRLHDRGFEVLGFPCNDFAGQEPGTEEEIRGFCDTNYKIGFPLFSKVSINNGTRHPLYAALIDAKPNAQPSGDPKFPALLAQHKLLPKEPTDVTWNFEKFLIGRDGTVVARFAPDVGADHPDLLSAIEAALG